MAEPYYQSSGDRFQPSPWTRGPWDPDAEHAGPPSALLGRAMEAIDDDAGWSTSRVTVEILRPIPMTTLTVRAEVVRPGRRVRHLRAVMTAGDSEVALASAWQIRTAQSPDLGRPALPHPLPDHVAVASVSHPGWEPSYFGSLEWRLAAGEFWKPGPAVAWMRMLHPLVDEEPPTPLTRVLVVADSGNGLSGVLGLDRWLYLNVELTVHLVTPAVGEWIALDAVTRIAARGIGLAESQLWDTDGWLGRGAQSLLVAERS